MSVLDDRIRNIARDELGKFTNPDAAPAADRVTELEQQIVALTARVDELEKTSAAPAPAAKRATRKTTEASEKTTESNE